MIVFFNKYKSFIFPFILLIFFICYITIFWGKWGNATWDCFREVIIPQAMLEGKILYADITCIYPPLAYQFNTLLFKIFGVSLNVLYFAGIISSFIIYSLVYDIIKKYSSDFIAFITVFSIMSIFGFSTVNVASWIFPYSYSLLYGFVSCVAAFYFYMLYSSKAEKKYLFLSALFSGIAIAFKYDFLLFVFLPIYEAIKSKSIKNFFYIICLLVCPFIMTFGIWYIQGGNTEILLQYKDFLLNFPKSPSVQLFNSYELLNIINGYSVSCLWRSIKYLCSDISKIFIFTGLFTLCFHVISNKIIKYISCIIITIVGCIYIIPYITNYHIQEDRMVYGFVYVLYLNFIITFFILLVNFIKKRPLSDKERFYCLTVIAGTLIAYRVWAAIIIDYIGNMFIIIHWLALIFFLFEVLPERIPKLKNSVFTIFIIMTIITYTITYLGVHISCLSFKSTQINISKGIFYDESQTAGLYNKAISFTKENIPLNNTVLVLPEAPIINFATGNKLKMKYYPLIPHIIETIGEDKIIEYLKADLPDYIYIQNNYYVFVGEFGISYAKKIYEFILEEYNQICTLKEDDNTEFKIMKLKNTSSKI